MGAREPPCRRMWTLALLGLALTGVSAGPATALDRPAVVELFTSQSCSSCPPADRLLGELAKREDVIALTYAVSYWDYLGWKDTLALPENAKRQREYAEKRWHGQVYTPQAVVNGLEHSVGSNLANIEAAMTKTRPSIEHAAVPVKLEQRGRDLHISVGAAPSGSSYRQGRLVLVAGAKSVTVPIKRGENAGRTVTYFNVVRGISEAGKWSAEEAEFQVPIDKVQVKDADFLVAILQDDKTGAIIGVAQLALPGKSRTEIGSKDRIAL